MPLRFFASTRTGELLSRLGNDVGAIQNAVTDTLLSLLSNAIMLVGGVVIIFVMAWRLTLVMLAVVPLAVIGMIVLGRLVRRISRRGAGRAGRGERDRRGGAGRRAHRQVVCA